MTQTIMIIDDEMEILDMLKRYFSLEGYWRRPHIKDFLLDANHILFYII